MHIYPLDVVHHLYMLHDDMYNVVDQVLFDKYLQIDILNLDMFEDGDDFYVLKNNLIINLKRTFYEYEQLIHPRSVNVNDVSIHLSHCRPVVNE